MPWPHMRSRLLPSLGSGWGCGRYGQLATLSFVAYEVTSARRLLVRNGQPCRRCSMRRALSQAWWPALGRGARSYATFASALEIPQGLVRTSSRRHSAHFPLSEQARQRLGFSATQIFVGNEQASDKDVLPKLPSAQDIVDEVEQLCRGFNHHGLDLWMHIATGLADIYPELTLIELHASIPGRQESDTSPARSTASELHSPSVNIIGRIKGPTLWPAVVVNLPYKGSFRAIISNSSVPIEVQLTLRLHYTQQKISVVTPGSSHFGQVHVPATLELATAARLVIDQVLGGMAFASVESVVAFVSEALLRTLPKHASTVALTKVNVIRPCRSALEPQFTASTALADITEADLSQQDLDKTKLPIAIAQPSWSETLQKLHDIPDSSVMLSGNKSDRAAYVTQNRRLRIRRGSIYTFPAVVQKTGCGSIGYTIDLSPEHTPNGLHIDCDYVERLVEEQAKQVTVQGFGFLSALAASLATCFPDGTSVYLFLSSPSSLLPSSNTLQLANRLHIALPRAYAHAMGTDGDWMIRLPGLDVKDFLKASSSQRYVHLNVTFAAQMVEPAGFVATMDLAQSSLNVLGAIQAAIKPRLATTVVAGLDDDLAMQLAQIIGREQLLFPDHFSVSDISVTLSSSNGVLGRGRWPAQPYTSGRVKDDPASTLTDQQDAFEMSGRATKSSETVEDDQGIASIDTESESVSQDGREETSAGQGAVGSLVAARDTADHPKNLSDLPRDSPTSDMDLNVHSRSHSGEANSGSSNRHLANSTPPLTRSPDAGPHKSVDPGTASPQTAPVIVALGSNLGNRLDAIEEACNAIDNDPDMRITRTSNLYESAPMYVTDQGRFLNGVCEIETQLSPTGLLDKLQVIEANLGRVKLVEKGPRNIDLDIVLYRNQTMKTERLTIPHKLIKEREFVVRPLQNLHLGPIVSLRASASRMLRNLRVLEKPTMYSQVELGPPQLTISAGAPKRQTQLMSILNVTPDSFSDGGVNKPADVESLKETVANHIVAGATIIDIGGQSSRPSAPDVTADEEIARILPAIRAIKSLPNAEHIAISIDTYRASVAEAAVSAGAHIINDISGGLLDPDMLPTIARLGCTYIMMHMRGTPATMQDEENLSYPGGLIPTIAAELKTRLDAAQDAGVRRWRIILDPGIGFSKTVDQNLEILRELPSLRNMDELRDMPWLIGSSRKGFVGKITDVVEAKDRTWGTAATVTAAIQGGAEIVRVHDVAEMAQVVKMSDAIYRR